MEAEAQWNGGGRVWGQGAHLLLRMCCPANHRESAPSEQQLILPFPLHCAWRQLAGQGQGLPAADWSTFIPARNRASTWWKEKD